MKSIIIVILAICVVGLGTIVTLTFVPKSDNDTEKFFLSNWALSPDNHLTLASSDLQKTSYEASAYEINKAIKEMKSIESLTDPEGIKLIEKAIEHLVKIEEEIKIRNIDADRLEEVSIESLNTLALVHLKLSDELANRGDHKKAMKSIRIAIQHLQNAVDMASLGSQRVGEKLVIDELKVLLDSLESNGHLDEKDYTISANDLVKLIKNNE